MNIRFLFCPYLFYKAIIKYRKGMGIKGMIKNKLKKLWGNCGISFIIKRFVSRIFRGKGIGQLTWDFLRTSVAALGIIIWLGSLVPEIFLSGSGGCAMDENGNPLTGSAANEFMEGYMPGSDFVEDNTFVYTSLISRLLSKGN